MATACWTRPEADWLDDVREFATEQMMELIRADLALLGVEMDVFSSEKSLYGTGKIEAAIATLREQGLIYEGVLEPPKGKTPEDWEPREQTLFRSTAHGDDVDRPVQKSDGSWTYFAPDIAYHFDKITRGFDAADRRVRRRSRRLCQADEGRRFGAVGRARAARRQADASWSSSTRTASRSRCPSGPARSSPCATWSSRSGADVTRFHMLTRKNDAPLDFDFDKVLEQSKDNPVFYVQYAHARVCSVLRRAAEAGIAADDATLRAADLALIGHPAELALARKIAEWPRLVEIAARGNEPHRIAFYLYELASDFHALWNRGNDDTSLRFLQEGDAATSAAKIALIRAVAVVISAGLGILGVTPAARDALKRTGAGAEAIRAARSPDRRLAPGQ